MTKLVSFGGVARSNEIPQRLLLGVRNPDRRQVATPKQSREFLRVATICLHPVSCLDRNQRRRDHVALDAHLRELPVEPVPAGTSLVADVQLASALQLLDRPTHRVGTIWNGSHR